MSEPSTSAPLLPWPATPPAHGDTVLREFVDADLAVGLDLSTDPSLSLASSLPPQATEDEARDWVEASRAR